MPLCCCRLVSSRICINTIMWQKGYWPFGCWKTRNVSLLSRNNILYVCCNTEFFLQLIYLTLYHSCSSWSENSVFSLRSCSISGLSLLFCFPMVTSLCVHSNDTTPGSDLLTKTYQLGHRALHLISREDQTCRQKRALITAQRPCMSFIRTRHQELPWGEFKHN